MKNDAKRTFTRDLGVDPRFIAMTVLVIEESGFKCGQHRYLTARGAHACTKIIYSMNLYTNVEGNLGVRSNSKAALIETPLCISIHVQEKTLREQGRGAEASGGSGD